MSARSSVLKNAFSMLTVRLLTPLSAMILLVVASRNYPVAEVGKYSLLLAFYQIAQYLPMLGLSPYIVKEVSKNRGLAQKYIVNMTWLGLGAALVTAAGLYIISACVRYPQDVIQAMGWVGLLVITGTLAVVYESIFIAYEKMGVIARVAVVESVLRVAISVYMIYAGYGIVWLIALMAVSRLLAMLVYAAIMKRVSENTEREKVDTQFIKGLFKVSGIFFAISICSTLVNRLDFVLLPKLRTFEELGFYTAGYRILDLCVLIASTLIFASFPALTRLYHDDPKKAIQATEKLVRYLAMMMALLVALVFSYASPIIHILYTDNYSTSAGVLKILVFTALFLSLDQLFSSFLIISNRQKLDLKVLLSGAVIYALLLFLLVPSFGMYGAAAATVLAMICQISIRYFLFSRQVFPIKLFDLVWKPVIAGLVTILVSGMWGDKLWFAPLSAVFYILILFVLKAIRKEDLAVLSLGAVK